METIKRFSEQKDDMAKKWHCIQFLKYIIIFLKKKNGIKSSGFSFKKKSINLGKKR